MTNADAPATTTGGTDETDAQPDDHVATEADADDSDTGAAGVPVHPTEHNLNAVDAHTDVHLPERVATAIAYRLGLRAARGDEINAADVADMAHDYVEPRTRFRVEGTDRELTAWLATRPGCRSPTPATSNQPIRSLLPSHRPYDREARCRLLKNFQQEIIQHAPLEARRRRSWS